MEVQIKKKIVGEHFHLISKLKNWRSSDIDFLDKLDSLIKEQNKKYMEEN